MLKIILNPKTGPSLLRRNIFPGLIVLSLLIFLPAFTWAQEKPATILASDLIDRDIYTKNGEQIGEIDDLVVKRNGKVKKVTMEIGGFWDIGDKQVAVSFSEFQELKAKADGNLVLTTTEQQMEKRPEFDYYERGLSPDYYYRPYYRYGYYPGPYYGPYYGPYHGRGPYGSRQEPREPYEWAHSPGRFLASSIMDRRVINERGAYIGEIEDLIINKQDGKVIKFILSVEDIRKDDAYVAVSYEPLGFTPYGVIYDLSQEKVRNMPLYSYED